MGWCRAHGLAAHSSGEQRPLCRVAGEDSEACLERTQGPDRELQAPRFQPTVRHEKLAGPAATIAVGMQPSDVFQLPLHSWRLPRCWACISAGAGDLGGGGVAVL